jgi:DNA repair protein RecO (recombination protein O)
MLHNVKGIVLRTTKYTDNSLIVTIYTDQFGLQTYMARGIHSRTSKVKTNYFQGLMVLDMIVTKSEKHRLERITEVTAARSLSLEYDFAKNAVALFLNELLYKTIKEEESNPPLFEFLVHSFDILALKDSNCSNFHLAFMLSYSKYLGFYPSENYSIENKYLDLMEGRFLYEKPHHVHYLDEALSRQVHELMNTKFETCEQVKITNAERKQLISALLDYYKLHNALAADLTSHLVLEQL